MATAPPDDDTRSKPEDEDPIEAAQELRARLEERDRENEELRTELARRDERDRQAGCVALKEGASADPANGSPAASIGEAPFPLFWTFALTLAGFLFGVARRRIDPREEETAVNYSPPPSPVDEAVLLQRRDRRDAVRLGVQIFLTVFAALSATLVMYQIHQQATEIRRQAADTLIVRRAQLLDTIYTEECTDPKDPETCKLKANPRAVQEAVLAFVAIEQGRHEHPDLSRANLSGADLRSADLSYATLSGAQLGRARLDEADLSEADLSWANLDRADLTGASLAETNLRNASLDGAILFEADLSGANFQLADLRNAKLFRTNLRGADLGQADLRGAYLSLADLSTAINLYPGQLASACGDRMTKLPQGFEMPDTWPCR